MRGNGGQALPVRAALEEAGKCWEPARVEHGPKDLPVRAVPTNDEHSPWHDRECSRPLPITSDNARPKTSLLIAWGLS